jgi:hypothetical protein
VTKSVLDIFVSIERMKRFIVLDSPCRSHVPLLVFPHSGLFGCDRPLHTLRTRGAILLNLFNGRTHVNALLVGRTVGVGVCVGLGVGPIRFIAITIVDERRRREFDRFPGSLPFENLLAQLLDDDGSFRADSGVLTRE